MTQQDKKGGPARQRRLQQLLAERRLRRDEVSRMTSEGGFAPHGEVPSVYRDSQGPSNKER